jgi:hypothetical protein
MRAGIDVGNSTTEVVLVEGREVVGADRVPTSGPKGGPASLARAARLTKRLVAAYGGVLEGVAVAPLRPIATATATLPEPPGGTGRLRVGTPGASTNGAGVGSGTPYVIGCVRPDGPVVALVTADRGFREILGELRELAGRGLLAAVVLERDEAVLVANRLPGIPVVDELLVADLAGALAVAVEVRAPLRSLVDPLWLTARLGLADHERADAARAASRLYDRSSAVVAVLGEPAEAEAAPGCAEITLADGTTRPLAPPYPPGLIRSYQLPGEPARPVDDLFAVDLAALADGLTTRAGATASRTVALAAMHAEVPYADPAPALSDLLGVPVRTAPSEAEAARLGALSTPGAPPDAVVVDLGGGTIDVITDAGERVLAGAGELLTTAAAAVLGTARTPAEWAKRGPSHRAEAPQLLLGEDGSRTFLNAPIRPDALGSLVVPGPAGWLPFDRRLAPSEWRALRLRLKAEVLGANLARGLSGTPGAVLVVGGPAGDDEVLGCVARALPPGTPVGRGDTAGVLGHRHAVAYGLALTAYGK